MKTSPLILFAVVLALLAGACRSTQTTTESSTVVADASSNASPTATPAPQEAAQSAFCAAIADAEIDADFTTAFADEAQDSQDLFTPPGDLATVKSIATVVPPQAPNIVAQFFNSWSFFLGLDEPADLESDDARDVLPYLATLTSISGEDLERYVAQVCPGVSFVLMNEAVTPPAELVTPDVAKLCPALADAETALIELEERLDSGLGAEAADAADLLAAAAANLPSGAPIEAAAGLRSLRVVISQLDDIDIERMLAGQGSEPTGVAIAVVTVAFGIWDTEVGAAYFDTTCPELRNTRFWLFPEDETLSLSTEVTESTGTREVTSAETTVIDPGVTMPLTDFGGVLEVGDINLAIGSIEWTSRVVVEDSIGDRGTPPAADDAAAADDGPAPDNAPDPDDLTTLDTPDGPEIGHFTVIVRFDDPHTFEATDFVMRGPGFTGYPADTARSVIGPERATLHIPTDRAVTSLEAWDLLVNWEFGTESIDFRTPVAGETTSRNDVLLNDIDAVLVDDLTLTVSNLRFRTQTTITDGADINEQSLSVDVEFDGPHQFEAWDFRLIDSSGVEFLADADQVIDQDSTTIRFAVDREVTNSSGWTLRISGASGPVDIGL